jgi:Na+/melibiose symporter-like transporter
MLPFAPVTEPGDHGANESQSLWRQPNFMRLWKAQMFSAFGSRITRTALPIIAVATLGIPDGMMGVLSAAQFAPGVIVAMFAGGYIDRTSKRRILIAADLVRALLVASLPIAWWLGALSLWQLGIVGAGVGAASALFAITDTAYLPALIGKDQLEDGNAKLETTDAIAEISGPAVAGTLIAAIGAPIAVIIDAVSYLWSAMWLATIRQPAVATKAIEPKPTGGFADLRFGLRVVFAHPHVRLLVLAHMIWSISGGFFMTLYSMYCLRVLHLSTETLGVVIASGGVGALLGALLSRTMKRRFGIGPTLIVASLASLLAAILIPLAAVVPTFAVLPMLLCHQFASDGLSVAYVIQAVTLRQRALPAQELGRCNAAIHVCTNGIVPIAALAAGGIAALTNITAAVWVGVAIGLLSPLLLLPLWRLKTN